MLAPPPPTPPDELCTCADAPPIKLTCALGYNPIHCMNCNLDVDPTILTLSPELVQEIAFWRSRYDAIYRLWLASGEYEEWAQAELSNIANPLNQDGLEIQRKLDQIRRCYYQYFQDQSTEDYKPLEVCPSCGAQLAPYTEGFFSQLVCDVCSIVVPGG